MLFSIDIIITILNFYSTIVIYFVRKQIFELTKENSVTYKFSPEQIYLANLLTSNTFPEDFLFGISVPVVDGK